MRFGVRVSCGTSLARRMPGPDRPDADPCATRRHGETQAGEGP